VSDSFDSRGPESFDLVRDVMIPMRDGTRLATDLYLPVLDHPVRRSSRTGAHIVGDHSRDRSLKESRE
jgi:hypothetical protein